MRRALLLILPVALGLVFFVSPASAYSYVYAYSTVDYDSGTNMVSGYSYTYYPYGSSLYYQPYVSATVYGENNYFFGGDDFQQTEGGPATVTFQVPGDGCQFYNIVGWHAEDAYYYVTYIPPYQPGGGYQDGYYDPEYYSIYGSSPLTDAFIDSHEFTGYGPVHILDEEFLYLGETVNYGSGTCDLPPHIVNIYTTDAIKSNNNLGNSNIYHFVTPKATGGTITLTASIYPDTPAFRNNFTWDGATQSSTNPLVATVSKGTASKNVVTIKYNGTAVGKAVAWVVWATITSTDIALTAANANTGNPAARGLKISGGYNFTHTIQPTELITDTTDKPDFRFANVATPPGGNHPIYGSGHPLSSGADKKWDASQQIRIKTLNPNSIDVNDTAYFSYGFTADTPYPSSNVEGNDDSTTGDETNDPYSHSGVLTLQDIPIMAMANRGGNDGDTFELRFQFINFTRLDIEGTWFRISEDYPWRIHWKFLKQSGAWIDNGSSKALDNSGF